MAVLTKKGSVSKPYFFKFVHQGRQVRKFGFATEEEAVLAQARERERLAAYNSGTFAMLVEQRLGEIRAYSTRLWYVNSRGILEQYKDWYSLPLSEITPSMVRERVIRVAADKGNNIANRHIVVLKSCFAVAVRDEDLDRNPLNKISKFPVKKARKFVPSKESIEAILGLANELDRAYLTIIWLTAARVREINNLRWEDIDLDRNVLTLWTRKKKGGDNKARRVYMVGKVLDALAVAEDYRVENSPWVFTSAEKMRLYPLSPDRWNYDYRDKFFHNLCRKAGVVRFSYHSLRHHTASALDQAGVPIAAIQSILGHEKATTTDDYLHELGRASDAMRALE